MTGQVLPSGTQRPVNQSSRLRILRFLGACGIVGLLLTRPAWNEASVIHGMIEFIGVALVLLCVFGRLWSTLYVGGRKNTELVVIGPYSLSRNPLYLFSTVGSIGIGLMFGSIAAAGLFGLTTYIVFFKTARQEEHYLRTRFGPAYRAYASRTPLFWPKLSSYQEPDNTTFSPKAVWRTFSDAGVFLMVFPLAEISEYLHVHRHLPMVLCIY